MNELQLFVNKELGNIRGVNFDGEAWVAGSDIAGLLGYKDTKKALSAHVDDEDKRIIKRGDLPPLDLTIEGKLKVDILPMIPNRGLTFINESGFYSLVMSSKLPDAKKFKRWVTSEVLPTLRKNGSYSIAAKPDSYTIEDPAARARRWAEEYEEKKALEMKVEKDKPKVEFANQVSIAKATDCIDFSAMAKILKNHDLNIGRNKLFDLARKFKWLRPNNEPYQNYINQGYFTVVEYLKNGRPMTKTLITGKGQLYITDKILNYYRGE